MDADLRPRPGRVSWSPPRWGILLLAGGIATWQSISERERLPVAWRQSAGEGAAAQLQAELRPGGARRGDLLRLEWPAHPSASSYRVRFAAGDGNPRAPISVPGTVFLYDLDSNVLRIPRDFEWEVSAVLEDGSEVVTPAQRVTLDPVP